MLAKMSHHSTCRIYKLWGHHHLPEAPGPGDSLLEITFTPIVLKQLKWVLLCLVRSYFGHVEKCHSPENGTLSNDHFQIFITFSCLKSFRFEPHIIQLYDLLCYHLPIFKPFSSIIHSSAHSSPSHPPVLLLP